VVESGRKAGDIFGTGGGYDYFPEKLGSYEVRDGWIDKWMYIQMNEWMDRWMDGWMDRWTNRWID